MRWPASVPGAVRVAGDDETGVELGAWELVGLGSFVVGCVVAGLLIGLAADDHWDSSPVGILVGLAVGVVVGIVGSAVRIARYLRS
jgi:F0F1-type ATP synthase assembly protein I